MPAKSKKQQEYFGLILAGKIKKPKGMTMKQVEEFAATKRKGLPEKKKVRKIQKMVHKRLKK